MAMRSWWQLRNEHRPHAGCPDQQQDAEGGFENVVGEASVILLMRDGTPGNGASMEMGGGNARLKGKKGVADAVRKLAPAVDLMEALKKSRADCEAARRQRQAVARYIL
jgi:hypothetical protein